MCHEYDNRMENSSLQCVGLIVLLFVSLSVYCFLKGCIRDRLSLCKEEPFESIVEGIDFSLVLSVPFHYPYAHLFIHPYSFPVST